MEMLSRFEWGTMLYSLIIMSIIVGMILGVVFLFISIRKRSMDQLTSNENTSHALEDIKQELKTMKMEMKEIQEKLEQEKGS